MSFLSYKPHVRQDGFHLPSPPPSSTTPPPNNHGANSNNNLDIFNMSASNQHFLPDAFRKFPSAANPDNTATAMDFENELASLIAQPQAPSSNERSTQSPHPRSFDENGSYARHIFDSVPLASSASSTTSAFSSHNPHSAHSQHSQSSSLHSPTVMSEFTPPHTQFNPAMRYDPHHPHPQHTDGSGPPPPPSSYHFNNRHTPSPIHSQSQLPHNQSTQSRSRSRSRPSSGGSGGATNNAPGTGGGIGPTRTTRTRRNSSFSSTSPPPHHHHHPGRPQAIVIPRSASNGHSGSAMSPISASGGQHENGGAWYIPNNPTSEFSLSESLHSHPPHSGSALHQGYTPFSLPSSTPNGTSSSTNHNSSDLHLPPVSALHPHSLPKSDINPHFSPSGLPSSYPVQGMNGMSNLNGINGINGGNLGNMNVNNINLSGGLAGSGGSPVSPPLNSPIGITTGASGGLGSGLNSNLNSGLNGLHGAAKTASLTPEEKQAYIANEKRRRRRESHNAVERRRRDNINERISELATLIPDCMLEAGTNQNAGSNSPLDDGVLSSPLETTSHLDMLSPRREDSDVHNNGCESNSTGHSSGNVAGAANPGVMKANKGIILRRSVEYIRYLQQLVTAQGARNRELEAELKAYRAAAGVLPSPSIRSASSTDGSSDEKRDTDSGLGSTGSEPGRTDSSSPPMMSDGEMPGMPGMGYQLVNGHKGHGHHPHALPNGAHHGHGHRRNGSGGFGSFGGIFGLPSMPEGDSEEGEEGDDDMGGVYMNDVMDGVLEGMDNMEGERLNRGRARVKVHAGGPGKIKKEQDLIAMEA